MSGCPMTDGLYNLVIVTPEAERVGKVFKLLSPEDIDARLRQPTLARIVAAIGQKDRRW